MFELSEQPLNLSALREALSTSGVGAVATFEGQVRADNRERRVTALEYEARPELARREFAKIEAETRARFEVQDVSCVHRTGTLRPGEPAVWIGVAAHHRAPAFEACRFIIDTLKKRLPIWKKEHYADGTSEWLHHG